MSHFIKLLNVAGDNILFAAIITHGKNGSKYSRLFIGKRTALISKPCYKVGDEFQTSAAAIESIIDRGLVIDVTNEFARLDIRLAPYPFKVSHFTDCNFDDNKLMASWRLHHTSKYFSKPYYYLVKQCGEVDVVLAEGFNLDGINDLYNTKYLQATDVMLQVDHVNPINNPKFVEFMYWA